MKRLAFLLVLASIALAPVVWAANSPVVGSWECISTTPDGSEMKWTLVVKEENGKLTGTAGSERGAMPLDELNYRDGKLSFRVNVDSEPYRVEAKVNGDKLEGSWSGGGESGSVKGERKP